MEGILHDLRFGLRSLRRSPGFALIAIGILTLGIGVNVAMLSVTGAVLFRDLPYEDADRVMVLWRQSKLIERSWFSIPTFLDWRERNQAFEALAMCRSSTQNLTGSEKPERLRGLMVSADFPKALGVRPHLGRAFEPEDDRLGGGRTVMLSYELWQRRFGGDTELLGQKILLDDEPYTVIAILPPGLSDERVGRLRLGDFWLPIGIFFDRLPAEDRSSREFDGVGRLKPGVSADAALRDMDRIVAELAEEHPATYVDASLDGALLSKDLTQELRPTLQLLLTAVGLVLLIACANLTNLLLTRAAYRDQELATRTALGASQSHLIRQLLVESLLVSLLGSLGGLGAAYLYLRLLPRIVTGIDQIHEARIDGSIVGLTFLLSLVISIAIGLIPALRATRAQRQLRVGGSQGLLARSALPQERLRQALAICELALALTLLIGTGLMLSTMARLRAEDPGFSTERILSLKLVLPQTKHEEMFPWLAYFDEALRRLRTLPGVEEVALTSLRPLDDDFRTISVAADRPLPKPGEMAVVSYQLVSPEYFSTLGVPLVEGRVFDQRDHDRSEAEPVVVLSQSLAQSLWPEESALGKSFSFEILGTSEDPKPRWRRIIGVVGDTRLLEVSEPGFAAYAPYTQQSPYFVGESPLMTLLVKTRGKPTDLAQAVSAELFAIDPNQPIFEVRSMSTVLEDGFEKPRMVSSLLSSFAALALALALVGVYGVIAYNVAGRTREVGTRMAFGATAGQILRLLLRQGLVIVASGVAIGLVAAVLLTRLMSSLLFGVETLDPATYLLAATALAAAGILAVLIPAWRAMRVSPAKALRYE